MGISRDKLHKRRSTGGKKAIYRKKRKNVLGRQKTLTRIGPKRTHIIRTRGGHEKKRALRLDSGNFSWGSEAVSRKSRILDVLYHPSDYEYVRTKTIVKNSIVQIDATPFRNWYASHYNVQLGKKKAATTDENGQPEPEPTFTEKQLAVFEKNQRKMKIDPMVEKQFSFGKLYACISSRPGQCGRADGYILEGRELEFYKKKFKSKKIK